MLSCPRVLLRIAIDVNRVGGVCLIVRDSGNHGVNGCVVYDSRM
jgi:hypothetical protein